MPIDVNSTPMGISKPKTYTISWERGAPVTPAHNPEQHVLCEYEVLDLIDQECKFANRCLQHNQTLRDEDPKMDRFLQLAGGWGGRIDVRFEPDTEKPKSIDATWMAVDDMGDVVGGEVSRVRWNKGEFEELVEVRVLNDGSHELLKLSVNSQDGTLTYVSDVLPPDGRSVDIWSQTQKVSDLVALGGSFAELVTACR